MAVLFIERNSYGTPALAAAHQPCFHHKPTCNAFCNDIGDRGLLKTREVRQCRAGTDPLLSEEVNNQGTIDGLTFLLVDTFLI